MDMKTFEYLYYKVRGYPKEEILVKARLEEEEFDYLESSLSDLLPQIEADRGRASNIGLEFVRLTRYIYGYESDQEDGITAPDAIKALSGQITNLPPTGMIQMPEMTLAQAIGERRTIRNYDHQPLSLNDLSFILWASVWVKEFRNTGRMEITLRNVPSAGSRHPFETYLLIQNVEDIEPGFYYYHPIKHLLIRIEAPQNIVEQVYDGCLQQEMVLRSAVTVILSAVPYRTVWRYSQRGYRYLYLDAGHLGQNIQLACQAVGAGACPIGAFQDEAMNDIIGADGIEEFVIYVWTIGRKPA